MNEQILDPNAYGYEQSTMIPVPAEVFQGMRNALDYLLKKESDERYPDLYKYVDKVSGAEVKRVTEKNKDNVIKIVDVERTLAQREPVVNRTIEGIETLRLKLKLEGVHMDMIKTGIAKTQEQFDALSKQAESPKMEVVE